MNAKFELGNALEEKQYNCRVKNILNETHRAVSLEIELLESCEFDFKPGQFVNFSMEINGVLYSRYYSISAFRTTTKIIRITIQKVESGLISNWVFHQAFIGMRCKVSQPMGDFTITQSHLEHPLVLFGAGSGVTPLLPMLQFLYTNNFKQPLHIFLSFSSVDDYIFKSEFAELAEKLENSNLHINYTQRSNYPNVDTNRLQKNGILEQCPDIGRFKAFISGSGNYVADMTNHLLKLKVESSDIVTEHFSLMSQTPLGKKTPIKVNLDNEVLCDKANGEKSILELAEDAGAYINSVCRNGLCGACVVRVEGNTRGGCTDVLDTHSIEKGIRLACCTYPIDDCSVFSDTSLS
ncbi:2Fe-2S iron-sulfur cluster-binding protein [Vibrio parahaemolyticus]|uniref:iron-sulfur cluster-binding domain-containing protein n=5 Tax=Vibrio parahaemolyticus TaxID=670 RepID=UPI0015DE6A3C|nr:iron-sulfur cluster-binding domain-containing protein [Vibrio parahaemolyticus]EIC9816432.1 iron-sulfur cluster-binding domain-containing protein [Vibrio alginolyticus]EJV0608085.1 iron-sulfur cluster-binding domain-containing protein [Vibrio parahaemolyticus]ELB2067289.1 iron-sulfur cluster-binding domain-containing protein [Vibrio parahaemolyticus]ELB2113226.1 iron-sulfur cluster-binding domain-containing protein [Vibrio parahaemolyticus]ELB2117553.1 iron-sulfur cluster-binding domain-con